MGTEELSIKPVEVRDLPWISAMLQKMVDKYFSHLINQDMIDALMKEKCTQEALSHEISSGMSYIKLVVDDDIQGFACYYPAGLNGEMLVDKLFVLPGEYEVRHLLALLTYVIEQAHQAGYSLLSLFIPPGDQQKLELLTAHGFSLRGEEKVNLCSGFDTASYVLSTSLSEGYSIPPPHEIHGTAP